MRTFIPHGVTHRIGNPGKTPLEVIEVRMVLERNRATQRPH
ncbi:hypothetical protein FVF58_40250 [Paraburkholderia panacisoli]|uniref:Mannose-6-phosphate isomerase type II C-terminal domain-containing protein n=1 Tax=Paraburkholderia panacisoli TaxID=2603818 RepID=A0A5B0GAV2_9BURK|nr:hypothetical protein FVF58_40250 [Paraburkholderia panacisoli]